MATLAAVAAHAKVGIGTVSRVLNDSPNVSPEMRELRGASSGGLEGDRLIDSVHRDDAQRLSDAIERSLADRCAVGVTVRFASLDDRWDGVRMVISPADGPAPDRLGLPARSTAARRG